MPDFSREQGARLLQLLGLPEGSIADEVIVAVEGLNGQAAALRDYKQQRQTDDFLERHRTRIACDRQGAFAALFARDPQVAEETASALPEVSLSVRPGRTCGWQWPEKAGGRIAGYGSLDGDGRH